jgi:uncharacterized membrane protein
MPEPASRIASASRISSFSPIHLLSIATLVACGYIVWSARNGDIRAHRIAVRSLYFGGIGIGIACAALALRRTLRQRAG